MKKREHPLSGFSCFHSDDPVLREDGLWRRGQTKKAFPDPHDPAGGTTIVDLHPLLVLSNSPELSFE